MMNNIITIVLCIMNVVGLVGWGFLTMLLMEVSLCKDARAVNANRMLSKDMTARLRLFRRSFRNTFYRATVCLFFGSMFGASTMLNMLYFGPVTGRGYLFSIMSVLISWGLIILYQNFGYRWTVWVKFKEYISKPKSFA